MTVSTTQVRVSYNGDGATVNFPVRFPFYASTDLSVFLGNTKQSSGYSVSGGGGATGTVTFSTAPTGPPNQQTVTIILDVPLTQLVNLVDGTAFPSATLNQVNDRAVQAALRLSDRLTRAIVAPDGDANPVMTLPDAGTRANTQLGFDSSGNLSIATALSTVALTAGNIGAALYARTPAESAAGVTPVNYAYAPGNILRYGADPTQTNDSTAAITNAIAVALQSGGGFVYIPAGRYLTASQIIWKNGLYVYGDGNAKSILVSTYTGGDQNVILNPINSSTEANVTFEDIQFLSGSTNSGKGNFADTGSTYLYFTRVAFSGNGINLILDQSEIVRIRDCLFNNVEANSIGLWIVNGSEHTAGADGLYTNEILVTGCQFLGPSTATLVADDGGHSHKFIANNFDSGGSQIRVNQCSTLLVEGNEMELGIVAVDFQITKVGGGAGATSNCATITQNLFSVAGNPVVKFGGLSSSLDTLEFTENAINSDSGVFNSLSNIGKDLVSYGNEQLGTGDSYFLINNYWSGTAEAGWTPTWSSQSGTAPTLGNGIFTTSYDRRGKQVLIRLAQSMGSTTTFTGTTWTWTLPVTAATEALNYLGIARALVAGATLTMGVANISSGGTKFSVSPTSGTSNWGNATPGAWASGDTLSVQLEYKAANWLG